MEFLDRIDAEDAAEQFSPNITIEGQRCLASWSTYRSGSERIEARFFNPASRQPEGPPHTVAKSGNNPFSVVVDGTPMVVWKDSAQGSTRARDGNEFENEAIYFSSYDGTEWSDPAALLIESSILSFDVVGGSDLTISWVAMSHFSRETLRVAIFVDGTELLRVDIEYAERKSALNRPAISRFPSHYTPGSSSLAIAYDRYYDRDWSIRYAEIAAGRVVAIETISESGARDFSPALTVDESGTTYAVWIALTDVVDDNGIVDQHPTIRGATKRDGAWTEIRDRNGSIDLASLGWGLLSIDGAPVWGYLGRRRKPILLAGRDVWICWERKSDHAGPTASTVGLLCGARIDERTVDAPRIIASGPRWYSPAIDSSDSGNRFVFAGRADPKDSTKELIIDRADIEESIPLDDPATFESWESIRVESLIHDRKSRQDGRTRIESRRDTIVDDPYWADLHVHSGLSSDAEGFVDELVTYARDSARIDVLLLQDNDHYQLTLTDSEYEYLLRRVERFTRDGEFVVIPGFEWTYFEGKDCRPNHRTVYGTSSVFPLLRNTEAGSDPISRFAAYAESNDARVHIHHERFSLLPNALDLNMEICSGWNLHMAKRQNRSYFHSLLDEGNRIGFVGGSDNHRRNPGMGGALTGIFADELTRDSIISALKNHRCFATNGARIVPRFEVAGGKIGERIETDRSPDIAASIEGLPNSAKVSIYRDGAVIDERSVDPPISSYTFQDSPLDPGSHYYYLEVDAQFEWRDYPSNLAPAIGGMAWTSPIWIDAQ